MYSMSLLIKYFPFFYIIISIHFFLFVHFPISFLKSNFLLLLCDVWLYSFMPNTTTKNKIKVVCRNAEKHRLGNSKSFFSFSTQQNIHPLIHLYTMCTHISNFAFLCTKESLLRIKYFIFLLLFLSFLLRTFLLRTFDNCFAQNTQ